MHRPAGGFRLPSDHLPDSRPQSHQEAAMNALGKLVFVALSATVALLVPEVGEAKWVVDGIPLCAASGDQMFPTAVSDGAGGAIVAWQDARGGPPISMPSTS